MADNPTQSHDSTGITAVEPDGSIVFTPWDIVSCPRWSPKTGTQTANVTAILNICAIPAMDPHQAKDSPPRMACRMWTGPDADAFTVGWLDWMDLQGYPMLPLRASLADQGWPVPREPVGHEGGPETPLTVMDLDADATAALMRSDRTAGWLAQHLDRLPTDLHDDASVMVSMALQQAAQ